MKNLRLSFFFAFSLSIHVLGVFCFLDKPEIIKQKSPTLNATIKTTKDQIVTTPRPVIDQPSPIVKTSIKKANKTAIEHHKTWREQVSSELSKASGKGLLYPEDAIRQGKEGTVQVGVFLNDNGQVIAARVEVGSGHSILDMAATAAVRRFKPFGQDAPREFVIPVVFKLSNS